MHVKLLGMVLCYIIYRSRNLNLCRAKDQWKVKVIEEFLHTLLLYQPITVKIVNVLAVL